MGKTESSRVLSELDVAELSYEQARRALNDVVTELESGSATLEESLKLWGLSEKLADRCEEILDAVSDQIEEFEEEEGEDDDEDDGEDD
jgi:exodeoxyribonuclease VII small subunit